MRVQSLPISVWTADTDTACGDDGAQVDEPDDGYNETIYALSQFWATMKQINAQFDLNSVYSYPA